MKYFKRLQTKSEKRQIKSNQNKTNQKPLGKRQLTNAFKF